MAESKLQIKITAVDAASTTLKSLQSGIIRLVGAVASVVATFKALTFPAKEAAAFEREMVNVAKTTNFTERQIQSLSRSFLDMSKVMSLSATDLASIAAIAGQLGLGSFGVDAVRTFTESVAKATVTLGLSAEQAAEFGAQISSIFNIDPGNIEQVFSTLNALSNTSVASAGQLADAIKRIGSVGGVTFQQSAALSAFFRDLGVQVEVLGTSTVKVFSNMSAKADKFAEVAGTSTKEWLELMEQDVVGALTLVTSKLYDMDRASRDALAKELFGGGRILSTYTKLIDDAANGYKRLYAHMNTANNSFDTGTSSLEEYDKVMSSLSEQSNVLVSSMRALAIEMGEKLTPSLLDAVKALQDFFSSAKGQDIFLQIADGIKSLVDGLIGAVSYLHDLNVSWGNVLDIIGSLIKAIAAVAVLKMTTRIGVGITAMILNMNKAYKGILSIFLGTASGAKDSAASVEASSATVSAALAKSTAAQKANASAATAAAVSVTKSSQAAAKASIEYVQSLQARLAATLELNASRAVEAAAQAEVNKQQALSLVGSRNLTVAKEQLVIASKAVAGAESLYTKALVTSTVAQEAAVISQIKLASARSKAAAAQAAEATRSVVQTAVDNLGALGTPMRTVTKSASFLSKTLGVLGAAFRSLLGPVGLAVSGLLLFSDYFADLLGLQSKVEVDLGADVRIQHRQVMQSYRDAENTIEELGAYVLSDAEQTLEIPLNTAPVIDKQQFAEDLAKQFKDAQSVGLAAQTIVDNLSNELDLRLRGLDLAAVITVTGTTEYAAELSTLQSGIDKVSERLRAMKLAGVDSGNAFEQASTELKVLTAEFNSLTAKAAGELKVTTDTSGLERAKQIYEALIEESNKPGNTIKLADLDAMEGVISTLERIASAAEYSDAAIASMAQAASVYDQALGLETVDRVLELNKQLNESKQLLEQANAARSAGVDRTKAAVQEAERQLQAYKDQKDQLEAIAAVEGSGVVDAGTAEQLAVLANKIAEYQQIIEDSYASTGEAELDALKQTKRIAEIEKKIAAEKASYIAKTNKEYISAIARMSKEEAALYRQSIKARRDEVAEINKQIAARNALVNADTLPTYKDYSAEELITTTDAQQANKLILDQFEEMITKRAILNQQLNVFDQHTKDALDTANRMDGAYDNWNKSIRAMQKSMVNYGSTIDDILRKTQRDAANKEFNLGIDKELKYELKDIDEWYKKVIDTAKSAGDVEQVNFLEGEKEAAVEYAKEQARIAKEVKTRANAEAEVTRRLKEQEQAQNDLRKVMSAIRAESDAGLFTGTDGIIEYGKRMIDLEEAMQKTVDTSRLSREALKDLARTEGVNPAVVRDYEKSLSSLDTTTIDLKKSQLDLGKSLATSTKELSNTERNKIQTLYSATTDEINALAKQVPGATKYIKILTDEANKSAKSMESLGGSVAKTNESLLNMSKNKASFKSLIDQSNEFKTALRQLGEVAQGLSASTEVSVGLAINKDSAATIDDQVTNILREAKIGTPLYVTEVLNQDGSKSFSITADVEADETKLQNSISTTINGTVYHFAPNDKLLLEDFEKSFRGKIFDIDVNANIVESSGINAIKNASGGHIRGPGSGTSDSILSWLSNGEYVIRASAVSRFGKGFFDMLNQGMLPRFATGGVSGDAQTAGAGPGFENFGSVTLNVGGEGYTLYGERKQAKGLINTLKKLSRG